ncbi:MAG: hypothetical protein ACI9U2_003091 [Bradymonadia bacterium]|jgi:hypothetical protein
MLPRLLLFAQIMTVWMLYDAFRRKADKQWYVIILLPFGEWFYFFSVKINDPSMRKVKAIFSRKARPVTLEELARDAHRTPSVRNTLRHAQGLFDADRFADSEPMFASILAKDPQNKDALYGASLCRIQLDDLGGAEQALTVLVKQDSAYRDFAAHLELCDVLYKSGARAKAIHETEVLIKRSSRTRHRVTLAHYLIDDGKTAHARMVLERAIDEFAAGSKLEMKRDKTWIVQARRMLSALG